MQLARSTGLRMSAGNNRYVHAQKRPVVKSGGASKARGLSAAVKKPRPKAGSGERQAAACIPAGRVVKWSVLLMVLLAGVSVGLFSVYRWLTQSEYFAVTEVVVLGASRLDPEEVAVLAAIAPGENSLAVNMQAVQARLTANPWIEKASVTRELPDRFSIRIVERQPCFWTRQEERLCYADRFGQVIGPVEGDGFTALPILEIGAGGEVLGDALSRLVEMAEQRALPFALDEAAWIRLSAGGGVEVHYDDKNLTYGLDAGRMTQSVRQLDMVLADLERRNEREGVRAVRVLGERVWVAWAAGGRP